MRIISGKYRHRIIDAPIDNPLIRPTKDRIREAIFSAIGNINGKNGLDLYAGSGSMGIEALSRDASFMTFVDHSKEAIDIIKKNIKSLDIKNCEVLFKEDSEALNIFIKDNRKFDIVFIDPPYKSDRYKSTLEILFKSNILNENAIIIVESESVMDYSLYSFKKIRTYHYGSINVDVLWL